MKPLKNLLISFSALMLMVSLSCQNKTPENVKPVNNGGLTLPDGFISTIFADNLGAGRHIAVNGNGDLYLALRRTENGKGMVSMRDIDDDGDADSIVYFINTATTGTEIQGDFLYFSNFSAVYRIQLPQNGLVPTQDPVLIAGGFPGQNTHSDKTFTLDGEGNLYVNVGAPSNSCTQPDRVPGTPGLDPCPQLERQAGIWRFRSNIPGQDQVADGHRYASGIRNSVAISWNYSNNKLYVVQHGRDQLSELYPQMYTDQESADLPAEEFFLVEDGDFFGWPYCYYDQIKKTRLLAPEYGGNKITVGRCADAKDPIMAFPGHLAPNDLLFYTGTMFPQRYRNGAFVAFHGSWNRAPLEQKGFFVVFVPFANGIPSGDMEIFADGFAGVDFVRGPEDAKYRPTGLAQGPDGSLYISDSGKGRIWKVTYNTGE
jgi:glucose/arabinose dehydrogenase